MSNSRCLCELVLLLVLCSVPVLARDNTIVISGNLELTELSDNAYVHVSYYDAPGYNHTPANGLIYINNGKAIMVDTPWDDSLTKTLVDWLRDTLGVEVDGVIVTHWHNDCMGGLREIQERGIPSYALNLTREIAARGNLPVPGHGFETALTLRIGDGDVIAGYFGAGHTVDNIVVWLPAEKILFGGCMIRTLGARGLGNLTDADVAAWPGTVEKVLARYPDADIVIPGHGAHGDIGLIHHTLELLQAAE